MRLESLSSLALGLCLAALGVWSAAQSATHRPAAALYRELCANCHGGGSGGRRAASLLDDGATAGAADDASIAKSIRDGRPSEGMPAMRESLSEAEIRGLVIYIREERAKAQWTRSTFEKPVSNLRVESQRHSFRLETVVEGVERPWSVAFMPDGRMLITERAGRLRIVENGRLMPFAVAGTPEVWNKGQGGLLDVAVHPKCAENGWVYLSYSDPGEHGSAMTAVVRGRLHDGLWANEESVFKAPPNTYQISSVHFGSRLAFDSQGYLFVSIGERGHAADAQDLSRPNGKVHRVHDNGQVPRDNPLVGRAGAMDTIWSYGHRNPQGLAFHPITGELWATEHGPRGGDELNRVLPGRNYGWPAVTSGMNYNGTPLTDATQRDGMESPVREWTPSITVSSMDFYTGDQFPRWKHHLFVTSLVYQDVRRLIIDGGRVVEEETIFKGLGRVRDIVSGPDGYLYVVFNEPDRIARLVPP